METPKKKSLGYVIVVIVITVVIFIVIGYISGMLFMSEPMGREMMRG